MNKVPTGFTPGSFTISNGDPTLATHPAWIDTYSTWLAAGYRPMVPNIVGEPLTSAVTHTFVLPIPQYTRWIGVGLMVCGRGSVEVNTSADAYNSVTGDLSYGTGTSGSHSYADAQWVWLDEPYQAVAGDGLTRALDVALDSDSGSVTLTIDITDESGTESLKVYQLLIWAMPPDASETLPS